ncbi:MAG TPA: carboxypeptidase-like regulatory domain-containing protein, partial [Vicinamibacterales bacterium]|nr:carboxypeptidase-like regulatory domain-containing protein [Vicinamibacterales bacterium]
MTGVVRDAQAATPLRHARVTPVTTTSLAAACFTDDNGRFSIDVVSNATLKVAKAGYVEETVKVPGPAGTDPPDLQVVLKRGAAITGRVVDETGAPLQGAQVVVWEMESLGRQGNALPSNDLGEFRVSGLSEGSFYVEAGRSDAVGAGPPGRIVGRVTRKGVPPTPPVHVRPGDNVGVGDIAIRTGPSTPASASAPSNLASDNTGSVAGRVRDTRGRPLKASVDLLRGGSETLATASNEQGWFRFDRVAPGAYFAEVARPGVLKVRFGQRSVGDAGTPIDVRAGRAVTGIDFVLSAGAAITGTVSDEYGEPVEGARIRVLQLRRMGDRIAALAPVGGPRWGTSDDRGRYRVFGLIPGRYLVVADGESSPMFVGEPRNTTGYAPIFYPNATNVAFALTMTVGQADVSDIDIAFRPEPVARISGTIVNSRGQPTQGFAMLGISQRSGGILLEPRVAPPTADGSYVFENVPPGDYVVQASVMAGGGRTTEFARADVTVTGAEPVQVPLWASPGARIRGRITVDAQPSRRPPVIDIGLPAVDLDQSMVGSTS